jgi:hypothetical protein
MCYYSFGTLWFKNIFLFFVKFMIINGLDEIINEAIRIAKMNLDVLEAIKNKSKELMMEDLFEIARIFFVRKNPESQSFSLQDFMKEDPEGYFAKVLKGFCVSLIQISESDISNEEKQKIFDILAKR